MTSIGKNMEKQKPLYISGENVKYCSRHSGSSLEVLQKVKRRITIWPSNFTPRYIPKRNKNTDLTRRLVHKCLQQQQSYLSFYYTSQMLWASQVALVVKNTPANAGYIRDACSVPGLGRSPGGGHGNPLHILAWRIPWTEEHSWLQCRGSQRVGHD